MPISATEPALPHAAATLREAIRRVVHHLNNAANAAVVNIEVVRMRLDHGSATADIATYARRASAALEQVAAGTLLIRILLALLAESAVAGAGVRVPAGEPGSVELAAPGLVVDPATVRLAAAAGVGLRTVGGGVILSLLRETAPDDVTS